MDDSRKRQSTPVDHPDLPTPTEVNTPEEDTGTEEDTEEDTEMGVFTSRKHQSTSVEPLDLRTKKKPRSRCTVL